MTNQCDPVDDSPAPPADTVVLIPGLASPFGFTIPATGTKTDITSGATGSADTLYIQGGANVDPGLRQSVVGTLKALLRYAKGNMGWLPVTAGGTMLHTFLGQTSGVVGVNGAATSDEVVLFIGSNARDSMTFTTRTQMLIDKYLEASVGS